MVKTIYTGDYRTSSEVDWAGVPVVELHHIERHVHGNGIAIKVWGEIRAAGKESVFAREIGLNTIQVMLLNPDTSEHNRYSVQKHIYHKGELDNYASIDIWGPASGEIQYLAGSDIQIFHSASYLLPDEGSLWLDFHALGE